MPILDNPKEERYCQFRCAGMSQIAAFKKAGYKKDRTGASRLASKAHIKARIAEIMRAGAKLAEVSAGRVLRELATLAFANMGDYMSVDKQGRPYVDVTQMDELKTAAISKLISETLPIGPEDADGNPMLVTRARLELGNKMPALHDLAKHLGLLEPASAEPELSPEERTDLGNRHLANILSRLDPDSKEQYLEALRKHTRENGKANGEGKAALH